MGSPIINTEDKCKLGKKIIESAALLEAGFAAILQAESEKVEELIKQCACKEELKNANELVIHIIDSIKDTEKLIIEKIKIGISLCEEKDDTECKE